MSNTQGDPLEHTPSSAPVLPSAASLPQPPATGRRLGQYTLLEKIGQGGMGAVYKGMDTALERTIALKVMFTGAVDDPTMAERFLREARSLARLTHPNLLHVYNVGVESGCYYFAMELLQGETLTQAIRRRKRIPIEEFIPYLGQILSALHYVHQQGITHRDIKSGNIMLCGRRPVLMDFGLAKDDNLSGLTADGAVLGTPDYMPPEQAEGHAVGAPSDLYSLGVVVYETLTGALPFTGRSALSIMRQHIDQAPPPIAAALPEIDSGLAAIVHQCLAKKPGERFPNCPALAAELLKIYSTPELEALLDDSGKAVPRSTKASVYAKDSGKKRTPLPSPSPASLASHPSPTSPLDATLLDSRAATVPATDASRDDTLADDKESGQWSGAPTVVGASLQPQPETEEAQPLSLKRVAKPRRTWAWVAAGFFGVLFLAMILGGLNKTPRKDWQGQTVLRHKADGGEEEIRWVEFKASDPDPSKWQHVIERKQPDGTWKRENIPHTEFGRGGDVLEFVPPGAKQ